VLRGLPNVTEATRARVYLVLDETAYVPNEQNGNPSQEFAPPCNARAAGAGVVGRHDADAIAQTVDGMAAVTVAYRQALGRTSIAYFAGARCALHSDDGGDGMSAAAIICQGPTGVGYFCVVGDLLIQDRGLVASRHGALLVCDAAIVAYMCAKRFPGQVHLVTNNLGSVACECQLIRTKLGAGITLYPEPSPFRGAPIDMIFVDRGRGTRSYVTTNYYPSSSHILTATRNLYKSLPPEFRTVLYVDVEAASDSGSAALKASSVLAFSGASVWNVGQVTQLSDVEDWLSGTVLPARAIVQVSLGNSIVTASELRSTYRRISSAANQTLVVTLGSTGAAWTDGHNAEVIAVNPISNAFTLGAGAVFATSLVMALAGEESPNVSMVVSDAVATATQYVRSATLDGDMQDLDYW
jgi:hypothetical protein